METLSLTYRMIPSRSTMAKKPSKHSINVVSDNKNSLSSLRLVFRTESFYFHLKNLKDSDYSLEIGPLTEKFVALTL